MGEMIEIRTLGGEGSFRGYLAGAGQGERPGIVVIQEIFGVNAGIRAKCDRFAQEGYVALAPDLFWRLEPGVELDPDTPDEFDRGLKLMGRFSLDDGIKDIEAAIRALRKRPDCNGRVGAVGYCLGGLLAYLTATRTDANASVGYYGVRIDEYLREAHAIANPLLLHIAEEDEFVPKEKQARVREALGGNGHVTIHSYPGQGHAFAREAGSHRNEEAAELADGRTREFFAQHLRNA